MAEKAPKSSVHEMAEAFGRYKQLRREGIGVMESCEIVGQEVGRHQQTIYQMVRRLQPTTEVAEAYLRAQSLRLAMRIVRKANAAEAIDILSRKNMAVLAPKTEESGGQGGFFLSVTAESCGAVKIGIASGAQRQEEGESEARIPRLGASTQVIDVPPPQVVTAEQEPPHEEGRRSNYGQGSYLKRGAQISDKARAAIQAARERLRTSERRRRRDQGDGDAVRAHLESGAGDDQSDGRSE